MWVWIWNGCHIKSAVISEFDWEAWLGDLIFLTLKRYHGFLEMRCMSGDSEINLYSLCVVGCVSATIEHLRHLKLPVVLIARHDPNVGRSPLTLVATTKTVSE
jgi:hypothetical protein